MLCTCAKSWEIPGGHLLLHARKFRWHKVQLKTNGVIESDGYIHPNWCSGDADDSENPKEVRRHQRIDSARQVSPAGRAPSRPESVGQSDYLSEYDASRGTTPVDSYDSEPEDPFPRKQERLKSAGTRLLYLYSVYFKGNFKYSLTHRLSALFERWLFLQIGLADQKVLLVAPDMLRCKYHDIIVRNETKSFGNFHLSSPIPSRQYQDKLEPFSHSRPYQQQPQPQRQPTNLHRNPTNISRRPQTAFTEPEYYGDYGEPMRPKSQNRPVQLWKNRLSSVLFISDYNLQQDWVDPNKIRSVLEEKDPFKNQPIRPKGSEKSRNNEPLVRQLLLTLRK